MTPIAPPLTATDISNLRWLSVIYGVIGGMLLLGVCGSLTGMIQGVRFLVGSISLTDSQGMIQDARPLGWILTVVSVVVAIPAAIMGVALLRLAQRLSRRQNYAGSVALAKKLSPLGLLAHNVLMRPSVKAAFNAATRATT